MLIPYSVGCLWMNSVLLLLLEHVRRRRLVVNSLCLALRCLDMGGALVVRG